MNKNDKLIVIVGVAILVIASFGIYLWVPPGEGEEITGEIDDFYNVYGVLADTPDSVTVSKDCPFYTLIATPLTINYDQDCDQHKIPLFVEDFNEPSSAVTRAKEMIGKNTDYQIGCDFDKNMRCEFEQLESGLQIQITVRATVNPDAELLTYLDVNKVNVDGCYVDCDSMDCTPNDNRPSSGTCHMVQNWVEGKPASLARSEPYNTLANEDKRNDSVHISLIDINVTKVHNITAGGIQPGEDILYTITVGNMGPLTMTGVAVDDLLPPGFVCKSVAGDVVSGGCSITDPRAASFTTSTISPYGVATIQITADVTTDAIENYDYDREQTDYNSYPNKNEVNVSVTIKNVTVTARDDEDVTVVKPHITFEKENFGLTAYPGHNTMYKITVTNTGNGTAKEINIVDKFPDNWTYNDNSTLTDNCGNIWNVKDYETGGDPVGKNQTIFSTS